MNQEMRLKWESTSIFVGIDPGLTGAIVVIDNKLQWHEVYDMPTIQVVEGGKKKNQLDMESLKHIFTEISKMSSFVHVCIEKQQSMGMEGLTTMMTTGKNYGILLMGLVCCDMPAYTVVTPQKWKKEFSVMKLDKKQVAQRCEEIYGCKDDKTFPIYGKRGGLKDGRSDAFMIAAYCRTIYKNPF